MSDSGRHSNSGHHRHHSGHHSHHSRYNYRGPRSTQASGLSEEYSTTLSADETEAPSVDRLNNEILDQDFYDEINSNLEKHLTFEEDRMNGYNGADDFFSDIEASIENEIKSSDKAAAKAASASYASYADYEGTLNRGSSESRSSGTGSSSIGSSDSSSSGRRSSGNRSSDSSYADFDDTEHSSRSDKSGSKRRKSRKSSKKHMDAWGRSKRRRRRIIAFLLILIGILLAAIMTFLVLRYKGEMELEKNIIENPVTVELPEEAEQENDDNLIIYNGERYWYNEDIITILCIGVDRQEFASPDDMVIGGNGQADADFLVILDKNSGKISFLNISRDAMTDIDRYNTNGQYIDTVNEQLCLSYAFGDGKQTSCENTALSVSRLLYGMPINAYAAIDFDSIATLNDAVGGVSVPVTEDIADKFPGTPVGALVKLVGSEAVTYVRNRDIEVLDSNNTRMSRQKQYIIAFLRTLLQQLKSDPTKAVSLFNAVSGNMVTSIKLSEVTYFGTFFAQHGFSEENMSSVQGEVIMGEDGFAQFIPDQKALFETVLNLFYIKE